MIVPKHYEDLNVLHENTLPARAYYIPASKKMDNLIEHREASDRMQLLNGNWKFKYFESIYDVKESFYETGYDLDSFDDIHVPGVWQMAGYDTHQYTNIRYPFPFDPPYVPQDIPCGAYVYSFDYHKETKAPKAYLNFEGVDSCYYVWLNGKYVGYDQVSHVTGEFDVTEHLKEGENTLAVLVKNKNLYSVFAWAVNIPLIIALIFTPALVEKWKGMYKLNKRSYMLATVGRGLVVIAGLMGSVPLMILFTAVAALGQGPWQGDMNAVIASCSEYTYLTQGKHVEGTMFSCTSFGQKVGGGIGTAITGWLLEASGYVGTSSTQSASAITMMTVMYLVIPFVIEIFITIILSMMNIEDTNNRIKAERGIAKNF